MESVVDYGSLLARVCLSAVFLYSGITKLTDQSDGRAEIVALGLPEPTLDLVATILCQIVCGLMVLLGFWARLGALALLGFTLCATLLAHRIGGLSGLERQRALTTILEHLAIIGGFLMIIVDGPGALSLDYLLR
jgi:putative oxidoreductase